MKEVWRTVNGFPEKLKVSNLGRIMSGSRILKNEVSKCGYYRIHVSHEGKIYRELVHRLVAMAFLPNPKNKPCVNHIDGDKSNNAVDNLEWCTYGENNKHAYDAGLKDSKGENNGQHKLTEEQVLEIRSLYQKRKINGNNGRVLAEKYGVNPKTITDIVNRKLWAFI